jgi:hypothetical protein
MSNFRESNVHLTLQQGKDLLQGKPVILKLASTFQGAGLSKRHNQTAIKLTEDQVKQIQKSRKAGEVILQFNNDQIKQHCEVSGGSFRSFWRKAWRGIKKVAKVVGKAALKPAVGALIDAVPGGRAAVDFGKNLVGKLPGGERIVEAVESVGGSLGKMSKAEAEKATDELLKHLRPLLMASLMQNNASTDENNLKGGTIYRY